MRLRLGAILLALLGTACTDSPVAVPLRALSSSGPTSFLCLDAPGNVSDVGLPLDECPTERAGAIDDFTIPHLYALVTQPNTASVAVVDLTTESDAVLDQDPSVPGANFLPVGAIPADIVSTPGGMASFVISREVQYEAIYALPSNMIRGTGSRLTSWPACALPAAPGEIELVIDPANEDGAVRPSCDADYGDPEGGDAMCEGELHCHGDLSLDGLTASEVGRYKLLVTLPSEGGFAVIDAQSVLDGEPGERQPCEIERWVPLKVEPPTLPPPPDPPESDACVPQATTGDTIAENFTPLPAGITLDDRLLYIADRGAPVIHRIDLPTPCEPTEISPLVTSSTEDPLRPVFTTRIAVSPPTLDLQRYLYAIDDIDGSIMVYDVSPEATKPLPLERENAFTNPFQPTDRIRFGAPPRDIILVQNQNDAVDDKTGSTIPVRCDPDPDSDGPGTRYRTSDGFDSGAGPLNLRGVFAFAVLESGDIVVIDVDDYDAPCRGPSDEHPSLGCEEPLASGLETSGEYSCNTVAPHQPRSNGFLLFREGVAENQPGLTQFPSLFDADGTLLQPDAEPGEDGVRPPRMRAVVNGAPTLDLAVGSTLEALNPSTGLLRSGGDTDDLSEHTLAMNLFDPRAHILDQNWTVTYEGALPGFGNRFAELATTADGFELRDVGGVFCTRGVRSRNAAELQFIDEGMSPADAATQADRQADFVQIFSETPVETDPYWSGQDTCTFLACNNGYGTVQAPRETRDLRVVEATDDLLALEPRTSATANAPPLECCFPGVVEYRVRGGDQWIVIGSEVGFLNRMTIADDGTCRPSCDENLALLTGRAVSTPPDTVVAAGDPGAFFNPFVQFAINAGAPRRNMQFELTTEGSFTPLTLSVVTNDADVQPTSIQYLSPTRELVVSDGSLEGITLLDLNGLAITRQYN
jgi:hypothetical protein